VISGNLGVLHRVFELSWRVSFDVIVAYPELSFASILLSKLLSIPLLVDFRTPMALQETELSGKRGIVRMGAIITTMLEAIAVKGSMYLLVITPAVKDYLVHRYRLPPKRIFIAPSGVNLSLFSNMREFTLSKSDLGIPYKAVVLGYVGSIHASRQLDFLVNAVKYLRDQNIDARLLLIGTGPDVHRLKKKVKQLDLDDRVIFTGLIPYEAVPNYLRCIDICVSHLPSISSYRMSFPLKVLEYMAMGKPVLASRIEAHQRIIRDGHDGLLYNGKDIEDFVAKVRLLAEDQFLRFKLAEAGRQKALNYSWQLLSEAYECYLNQAINDI
jgi:glycosyltransferase involved in cell wall biosynthesis